MATVRVVIAGTPTMSSTAYNIPESQIDVVRNQLFHALKHRKEQLDGRDHLLAHGPRVAPRPSRAALGAEVDW